MLVSGQNACWVWLVPRRYRRFVRAALPIAAMSSRRLVRGKEVARALFAGIAAFKGIGIAARLLDQPR